MNNTLSLRGDWAAYNGTYRKPSWGKQDALCVLSGVVVATGGAQQSNLIAVIDEQCRPAERLVFSANHHSKVATVAINPNGDLLWLEYTDKQRPPRVFLSLDGIKYLVP